jgi:hypothetical protein
MFLNDKIGALYANLVAAQKTVECVAPAGKRIVVQERSPASATHSIRLHAILWCYLRTSFQTETFMVRRNYSL